MFAVYGIVFLELYSVGCTNGTVGPTIVNVSEGQTLLSPILSV